jgi:TPR repeat protein
MEVCERYGIRYEATREAGWDSLWRDAHESGGAALAQFLVGWMHSKGLVVGASDEDAFAWYERAAERGLAMAEFCLGFCYENGLGHAVDKRRSMAWCERAATKGHPHAQYLVGCKYLHGDGVECDRRRGVDLLKRSAAQGVAQAMCVLGAAYMNEPSGGCDERDAIRLWRMAADIGDVTAQFFMGWAYQHGRGGLEQDNRRAAEWYSGGAHGSDPDCTYQLGAEYLLGEGLPYDAARGVSWMLESASQGNDKAEMVLMTIYEGSRAAQEMTLSVFASHI